MQIPLIYPGKITPPSTLSPLSHEPDFIASTLPSDYKHLAVGGTFDHLHVGHKILLMTALWLTSRRLVVGVSNMESLKKKTAYAYMETIQERTQHVKEFLDKMHKGLLYDVVPILDPYGPTQYDDTLTGIVGSLETRKGCESGKLL